MPVYIAAAEMNY